MDSICKYVQCGPSMTFWSDTYVDIKLQWHLERTYIHRYESAQKFITSPHCIWVNVVFNIYPPKTSLTVHTLLCYYVMVSGFLLILQSLLDFLVSGIVFFMVLVGLSDHFILTGVTNWIRLSNFDCEISILGSVKINLKINGSDQGPLITDGRNCCKWTYH